MGSSPRMSLVSLLPRRRRRRRRKRRPQNQNQRQSLGKMRAQPRRRRRRRRPPSKAFIFQRSRHHADTSEPLVTKRREIQLSGLHKENTFPKKIIESSPKGGSIFFVLE